MKVFVETDRGNTMGLTHMRRLAAALLIVAAAGGRALGAAPLPAIEFRLVAADAPGTTVDAFDRQQTVFAPMPGPKGMVMEKVGLDVTCWCRGVLLDGEPLFEIYHDGKYVDRVPRARRNVSPGRHVLAPGEHAFTVAPDGNVSAESPELIVEAGLIRIKAYPVSVRAYTANPEEGDLPQSMRLAPLPSATVRDAVEMEAAAASRTNPPSARTPRVTPRDLLPVFDDFAPLTVWLPANRQGRGYVLHPMGYTFHVTPEGLAFGAGGGDPLPPGVKVAGRAIEIPLMQFPVRGDKETSLVATGVQKVRLREEGIPAWLSLYPRRDAYELRSAPHGAALSLAGDLLLRPVKALGLDQADPGAATRGLLVELDGRHFRPGQSVTMHWQATAPEKTAGADAMDSAASNRLSGAVLEADFAPPGDGAWRAAEVASATAGESRVTVPAIPDGVYRLRLGVRCAGAAVLPLRT